MVRVWFVFRLSIPEMSLHKKVFHHRKMSKENRRPSKGKGGRVSPHSDSFRVQVALEYINGDYSYPQVGTKYGLPQQTIARFVSWYKKNQDELMSEETISPELPPLSPKEQQDLEKRLALAEMKIAALEKVIAIANEEYGTDLKKKAATK
jgi:transposase-like protein